MSILLLLLTSTALAKSPAEEKFHRAKSPRYGSYIVVLNDDNVDDVDSIIDDLHKEFNGKVVYTYRNTIYGAAFSMTEQQAMALTADPRVKAVWEDAEVELARTQYNAAWNIDRIDTRMPTSTQARLDTLYNYCSTGAGVRAYVVDTGIWKGHAEFSNPDPITGQHRVPLGFDYERVLYPSFPNQSNNPCPERQASNMGGSHGTAVASVLGGRTMGVAKDVVMVPVRVFGCSGFSFGTAAVVAGIDWIPTDPGYVRLRNPSDPGSLPWGRVVNMSWVNNEGTSHQEHPIEAALRRLPSDITLVGAAGNFNTSIGTTYVPARMSDIIVAGGSKGHLTSSVDDRWNDGPSGNLGSNYGPTVDLFAPADRVLVAHWTTATSTRDPNDPRFSSGTSFAAPLVAGAAARILESYPSDSRSMIEQRLVSNATTTVHGLNLADRRDSPNRLLYIYDVCRRRSTP